MNIQKRCVGLVFAIILTALMVSACGFTTTGTGTTSSYSISDDLQKSAAAMKQLKTAHIDINATIQGSGSIATPDANGTTKTPTPSSGNISVTGSGDEQLPDQMKMDLTVNVLSQAVNVSEVTTADKLYVKSTDGKWYVIDKSAIANAAGSNPLSGFSIDQSSLLAVIQHAQITDHNLENVKGQNLRHISAALDKQALKDLINQNPQLKGVLGQQDIDTALNNLTTFKSSVDVWIDEDKFYLHSTELKLNLGGNASANGASGAFNSNIDLKMDLSKFDVPVTITAPANATPVTNPGSLLGGGQ